MFTGLYPRHHRVICNGMALDDSLPTLAGCLAAAGYQTYGVGKFHLQPILAPVERAMPESAAFWSTEASRGWEGPYFGFEQVGFAIGEADLVPESGGHYVRWLEENHPEVLRMFGPEAALDPAPVDMPDTWKCAVPPEWHYNTWIAEHAVDFLQRAEPPFFLYASFPDPHHPFTPSRPYSDRYRPEEVTLPRCDPGEIAHLPDYVHDLAGGHDQRTAAEQGSTLLTEGVSEPTMRRVLVHTHGMIDMLDERVGWILDALEQHGRSQNTIVIFTSDHGEYLGDHGLLRKGPLTYRQVREVPMVIRGPGIDPGHRSDSLTGHIDLMPTVLDFAGVPCPTGDGQSLRSLLEGRVPSVRDYLFTEYHPRNRAFAAVYNQTVVTRNWRLSIYPCNREWDELFDLREDPDEHHNLRGEIDASPAELGELLSDEFPPMAKVDAEQIARW